MHHNATGPRSSPQRLTLEDSLAIAIVRVRSAAELAAQYPNEAVYQIALTARQAELRDFRLLIARRGKS